MCPVSSDTPQVVCLHDFADHRPLQAPDQARYPPETPNMPTNCGSPAWGSLRRRHPDKPRRLRRMARRRVADRPRNQGWRHLGSHGPALRPTRCRRTYWRRTGDQAADLAAGAHDSRRGTSGGRVELDETSPADQPPAGTIP